MEGLLKLPGFTQEEAYGLYCNAVDYIRVGDSYTLLVRDVPTLISRARAMMIPLPPEIAVETAKRKEI